MAVWVPGHTYSADLKKVNGKQKLGIKTTTNLNVSIKPNPDLLAIHGQRFQKDFLSLIYWPQSYGEKGQPLKSQTKKNKKKILEKAKQQH